MIYTIEETIFIGKDNTFTVEYAGITFPTATRIEFSLNGTTVNSVDDPTFFTSTLQTDGRIIFKLGAAGYVVGDAGFATVCIFDASNTNGVVYSSPTVPTRIAITLVA